ncbi:hypothetical protein ES705_33504 [subsurface metagenome]
MAQRKSDRTRQAVEKDAKARGWKDLSNRKPTITFTVRLPQADGELLERAFRKQGQTKSQGLRAILNQYIDTRIR